MGKILFIISERQGNALIGSFIDQSTKEIIPVNGRDRVQTTPELLAMGGIEPVDDNDPQRLFERCVQIAYERNKEPSSREYKEAGKFWRVHDGPEEFQKENATGEWSLAMASFGEFLSQNNIQHPTGYAGWFDYFAATSQFNYPRVNPFKPIPNIKPFFNEFRGVVQRNFESWEQGSDVDFHWHEIKILYWDTMSLYHIHEEKEVIDKMRDKPFEDQFREELYYKIMRQYKIRKDTPRYNQLIEITWAIFNKDFAEHFKSVLEHSSRELLADIKDHESKGQGQANGIKNYFAFLNQQVPQIMALASKLGIDQGTVIPEIPAKIEKYSKQLEKIEREAHDDFVKARESVAQSKVFLEVLQSKIDEHAVAENQVMLGAWKNTQEGLAQAKAAKKTKGGTS